MIGPSPEWARRMQRHGRREMKLRFREEGAAVASDYGRRFEREANEWLARDGFSPVFVFEPIAPPATAPATLP